MSNYYQERDEKNLQKIDDMLGRLPEFVGMFIVGISSRTSTLTRMNYVQDIMTFFEYLCTYKFAGRSTETLTLSEIEHITPYDIERYLDGLTSYKKNGKRHACGDKTKERRLSALRSLYKYLYKKEMIDTNVTLKVDMPKIHDKPIVRLENDEVNKMMSLVENGDFLSDKERAANETSRARDMAILYLFLGTGIRVSELVGLNQSDFDFENGTFTVTRKGGNQSILYLPQETSEVLQEYLRWLDDQIAENTEFARKIADRNILFYSLRGENTGGRIGVRAVENLVKKYASYATPLKKITPHKLRSTYATNLYRATEDIYVVADVLGHSDVNTTKRHYAQMSEEHRRRAAKITTVIKENDDD